MRSTNTRTSGNERRRGTKVRKAGKLKNLLNDVIFPWHMGLAVHATIYDRDSLVNVAKRNSPSRQ